MRPLLAVLLLLGTGLTVARGQPAPTSPAISLSASMGGAQTVFTVRASGLPGSATIVMLLITPDGSQTSTSEMTRPDGSLVLSLTPPANGWSTGLYRVVLGVPNDLAEEADFSVSDGFPHLSEQTYLPSPTSALNIVGTGLPPGTSLTMVLWLTGGQDGARSIPVTTDATGSFTRYIWPQQLGLPFFAAGNYRVTIPSLSLISDFTAREHPVSASMSVSGPVLPDRPVPLTLQNYSPEKYLWTIVADAEGRVTGESLVGPTDVRGGFTGLVNVGAPSAGRDYLATPLDWGETTFIVPDPTPTPTAASTNTPLPTVTPVPTVTPTPAPRRVKASKSTTKKCRKVKRGAKRRACK